MPRAISSLALWKKYRPKSNSAPVIGWPSTVTCASGRCQPRGRTRSVATLPLELVALAAVRIGEVDRAADRVAEVDLAVDQVGPGRRGGVLEVGHEHGCAGVERVDHHLAIDRAGDLDAPVLEVGGHRRDLPVRLADRPGLLEEIGQLARLDARIDLAPAREQLPARSGRSVAPARRGRRARPGSGSRRNRSPSGPEHHHPLRRGKIVPVLVVDASWKLRWIGGDEDWLAAPAPDETNLPACPGLLPRIRQGTCQGVK